VVIMVSATTNPARKATEPARRAGFHGSGEA
jgi:hypothetical protein